MLDIIHNTKKSVQVGANLSYVVSTSGGQFKIYNIGLLTSYYFSDKNITRNSTERAELLLKCLDCYICSLPPQQCLCKEKLDFMSEVCFAYKCLKFTEFARKFQGLRLKWALDNHGEDNLKTHDWKVERLIRLIRIPWWGHQLCGGTEMINQQNCPSPESWRGIKLSSTVTFK